jgi:hypothetical protein
MIRIVVGKILGHLTIVLKLVTMSIPLPKVNNERSGPSFSSISATQQKEVSFLHSYPLYGYAAFRKLADPCDIGL